MKKIICLLLCIAICLSLFTAAAVMAADGVAVTLNGVDIDGKTDMPISFVADVTFPYEIYMEEDLSGIHITSASGENIYPSAALGALTNDCFTDIKLTIPVLEQDTRYTLIIPAIDVNPLTVVSFATIPDPYLVIEDFNTRPSNNWYTTNSLETAFTTIIDTDGDGVKDSANHTGSRHLTYAPGRSVTFPAGDDIVIETRVRYTPRLDEYKTADGALKADFDTNNGGLLYFNMTGSTSILRVRTDSEGHLTYGEKNGDTVISDFKLYVNEWYTIRITMPGSDRKKYSLTVTDDYGNSYSGPETSISYSGSYPITGIGKMAYSYAWFFRPTVDYLYVWNNSTLDAPTATYGKGQELEGTTELHPTDPLTATVNFTHAVTASDMAKISVSSGAAAEKALSADGKTVTVDISQLTYEKTYGLIVPKLGGNASAVFSFTTLDTPPHGEFEAPVFEEAQLNAGTPVTASINFTSYNPEDILVMIVFYNEQNQVTHSVSSVSTTGKHGEEAISVKALPFSGDVKAKAFVWSRFDTMQPLTPMAELAN